MADPAGVYLSVVLWSPGSPIVCLYTLRLSESKMVMGWSCNEVGLSPANRRVKNSKPFHPMYKISVC